MLNVHTLVVLYTQTMLLHQKNAVTTSKSVIAISCYHIKIRMSVIGHLS